MPLLSLVPPSLWFVFPLFLWRGCWYLPPMSAAPSPAPGGALEQGKDLLVCTKTTRKEQGPREPFWIYFPAVFAWAARMEHVKSAMKPCSVCWGGERVLLTVSVLSEECLHAQTLLWLLVQAHICLHGSLLRISMILVPHPAPKIPKKTCYF